MPVIFDEYPMKMKAISFPQQFPHHKHMGYFGCHGKQCVDPNLSLPVPQIRKAKRTTLSQQMEVNYNMRSKRRQTNNDSDNKPQQKHRRGTVNNAILGFKPDITRVQPLPYVMLRFININFFFGTHGGDLSYQSCITVNLNGSRIKTEIK